MSTYRDLGIPTSSSTVTVKVFDSIQAGDHAKVSIAAENFYAPILPGHTKLACPVFVFLIEHPASGTKVMFDLGLRKDLENAAPPSAAFFQQVLPNSERDVVDLLAASGVPGESLSAVIWSHAHADHSGDMSRLPTTVDLVISKDLSTETYETDPHSVLLPSDFAGRKVVKIDFDASMLKIGGFRAHDYFWRWQYHQAGHICGLVRVTPTTFLLLGGDACHHPGALRPTQAHRKYFPCPGALVEAARKSVSGAHFSSGSADAPFDLLTRDKPMLHVHEAKFHADAQLAQTSVDALTVFDGNPDVFVVLAHDSSLLPLFDNKYPVVLNAWKEMGWKERNLWAFLEEGNPAFRFDVRD
ncbi:Metallo-beta-lactamase superfamily protein [Mycena chlorophos]|uniref:Metallo-beta-lactamase superfamily protein n=1 Tax=Mycena chlorophos TaxID=658473 RepID=A0A8H6W043_MYCCL|nr:Metallo-beta-lactamase superfamily protein [Mycena chlorophos]